LTVLLLASAPALAQESCDDGCPSWTGGVNWLYMWRETTGNDFPLILAPTNYNSSQIDADGQSGIDAYFSSDNGCGKGWDVRYLWAGSFDFSQNGVFIPGAAAAATNPLSAVFGNFDWTVSQDSELHSVELLRRRDSGRLSLNYGFRWANLDETLELTPTAVAGTFPHVFGAENNLYGFQLGLDGTIWDGCRFGVDGFLKAGIYANQAEVGSSLVQLGVFSGSGVNSSTHGAFLGELGVTGRYDVSDRLTLRGGYQIMFLDGVALAADQVSSTGDLTAGGATNVPVSVTRNTLIYHGLNFGVEFRH
jgi:hypothetical protein